MKYDFDYEDTLADYVFVYAVPIALIVCSLYLLVLAVGDMLP